MKLEVRVPGGSLQIELDDDYRASMTGPAERVHEGEFSSEFLEGVPCEGDK